MGTSREGLLSSNRAEIASSPNQAYVWVWGFGWVWVFLHSLPWSQKAQNTLPSATECITPTSSVRSSV